MIDFSLNEAETLAAKVARGAGFSWGLAEDIGRAARGLARRERNWAEALRALAESCSGFAAPSLDRVGRWRRGKPDLAGPAPLCPIRTAAVLSDGVRLPEGGELLIRHVGLPIWLTAMLDATASQSFTLRAPPAATLHAGDVTIVAGTASEEPIPARRAQIDGEALTALLAVAERTYVPESERSRARGAGGGSVDDE